jgi:hypothetical protein
MLENVGTALQTSATTGNGETLVLPEPRLVTFKVQGNGPVSGRSGNIGVLATKHAHDSGSVVRGRDGLDSADHKSPFPRMRQQNGSPEASPVLSERASARP